MKTTLAAALILFSALAAHGQNIPVIKINQLEDILTAREKEILIVNFWATWCAPCVKELPYFESLHQSAPENMKIVLVSLDFADKIDRVKAFVNRKQMSAPVVLLDEIDYNSWIDKVDRSWQGAIPATLILNTRTGQRKFIAKELEEGQLERLVKEISKG